jgi:arsenate reductase (glutaredoxin)
MIQILVKKKCQYSKKAERFFKERRIEIQVRNMEEKPLSEGEWKNVLSFFSPDELIDKASRAYKKKKMSYMEYDALEEMKEEPGLVRTPIVRNKGKVTVGHTPKVWEEWLAE